MLGQLLKRITGGERRFASPPAAAKLFVARCICWFFIFVGVIYGLVELMNKYQVSNGMQWFALIICGLSFGFFLAFKIINFID